MKKRYLIYFSVFFTFMYLPIGVLFVNAFNSNRYGFKWDGFTFNWFEVMFDNRGLMEATFNSLFVAFTSSSLATVLGTGTAITLYLYSVKGKKVLLSLLLVIMMIPDIIMGIAFLIFLMLFSFPLGFWSLLIAHTTFCLPFAALTVHSRLKDFDKHILDAAKDLGASEFETLRKVIIPMLLPAIVASWLLCFTLSMDDVIVSSFVTGPSFDVLPLKIFSMVKVGVKPEVNALATIMITMSILFVFISYLYLHKENN